MVGASHRPKTTGSSGSFFGNHYPREPPLSPENYSPEACVGGAGLPLHRYTEELEKPELLRPASYVNRRDLLLLRDPEGPQISIDWERTA